MSGVGSKSHFEQRMDACWNNCGMLTDAALAANVVQLMVTAVRANRAFEAHMQVCTIPGKGCERCFTLNCEEEIAMEAVVALLGEE